MVKHGRLVHIRKKGGKYDPNSFTAFIYTDLAKTIILLRTQKATNLAIKADHLSHFSVCINKLVFGLCNLLLVKNTCSLIADLTRSWNWKASVVFLITVLSHSV